MALEEELKGLLQTFFKGQEGTKLIDARITSVNPVSIRLQENAKLTIPSSLVTVPRRLRSGDDALKTGDKVMVIKQEGGQSFYVLDAI